MRLLADRAQVGDLGRVRVRVGGAHDVRLVVLQDRPGGRELRQAVLGLEVVAALDREAAERDDAIARAVPRAQDALVGVSDGGHVARQGMPDVERIERLGEVVRHLDDVPQLQRRVGHPGAGVPQEEQEQHEHHDQGRGRQDHRERARFVRGPRQDLGAASAKAPTPALTAISAVRARRLDVRQREQDRDERPEGDRDADQRLRQDRADRRQLGRQRDAGGEAGLRPSRGPDGLDDDIQGEDGGEEADGRQRLAAQGESDGRPEQPDGQDDQPEHAQRTSQALGCPSLRHCRNVRRPGGTFGIPYSGHPRRYAADAGSGGAGGARGSWYLVRGRATPVRIQATLSRPGSPRLGERTSSRQARRARNARRPGAP